MSYCRNPFTECFARFQTAMLELGESIKRLRHQIEQLDAEHGIGIRMSEPYPTVTIKATTLFGFAQRRRR